MADRLAEEDMNDRLPSASSIRERHFDGWLVLGVHYTAAALPTTAT